MLNSSGKGIFKFNFALLLFLNVFCKSKVIILKVWTKCHKYKLINLTLRFTTTCDFFERPLKGDFKVLVLIFGDSLSE